MTDVAIKVEGLGKRYRIGAPREKYRTFRGSVSSAFTMPIRAISSLVRRNGHSKDSETIWALKNISFEIKAGEVVGVIGGNGAGKSTLLKVLSRITDPTEGMADIHGRVGSLLEVGTGFHPELTGRENTALNGAILGMTRKEIESKFDEIVAFAEIEKFIDTAVKHYSSGMYLRLAFAVAAHLDPEILLVDEVLAVGDAAFQKKCLGKMGEVAKRGRTVLFVSHNMGAVSQLCTRGLLLSGGELVYQGEVSLAVNRYLQSGNRGDFAAVIDTSQSSSRSGTGEGKIVRVELVDEVGYNTSSFAIGQPFGINLQLELDRDLPSLVAGVEIKSPAGVPLVNLRSDSQGIDFGPYKAGTNVELSIRIPGLPFYPGVYSAEPWFAEKRGRRIDQINEDVKIILDSKGLFQSERMFQEGKGLVVMDCDWLEGVHIPA
jgi:lipopolysaccharide transport system ATP-binding protein